MQFKSINCFLVAIIAGGSLGCKSDRDIRASHADYLPDLSENVRLLDTVFCFKKDPHLFQNPSHIFYGTDTVLRYGPFYFGDKVSILLGKIKNSSITEYSLVFTDYSLSPRPVRRTEVKELDRNYGSKSEFTYIADSLTRVYGTPTNLSDTVIAWLDRGIQLRAYNRNTSLFLTYFKPNDRPNSKYDWQFCAIIPDLTLLTLRRGIHKDSIKFKMRDTIFLESADTVSFRYTFYTMFGLPGILTCMINSNDEIINYAWDAKSTGDPSYESLFTNLSEMLQEDVKRRYPNLNTIADGITKEYRWSNDNETIYTWYYIQSQSIVVGKASNEYVESLNPVVVK